MNPSFGGLPIPQPAPWSALNLWVSNHSAYNFSGPDNTHAAGQTSRGTPIAVVDEIPAQSGEDVKHVDEPLAAFQAFGSALEALRDRFAEARSLEAEKLRGEAQTW